MTSIDTATPAAGSGLDALKPYGAVAARILLAIIFIMAGWQKIGGYAGTQGYMEAFGVPGALLPAVIALEIVGGLLIVVGLWTRITALALAAFTLVAGFIFHFQPEDQIQMIMLMKNLGIAGGFILLAVFGPGGFALDNRKR